VSQIEAEQRSIVKLPVSRGSRTTVSSRGSSVLMPSGLACAAVAWPVVFCTSGSLPIHALL
jgi:hypothetical protein